INSRCEVISSSLPAFSANVPSATEPPSFVLFVPVATKISGTVPGPTPEERFSSMTVISTPGETNVAIFINSFEINCLLLFNRNFQRGLVFKQVLDYTIRLMQVNLLLTTMDL